MRALSIRQPHAEAILRGIKTIEFRSQPTGIRERIYIYASLGRGDEQEETDLLRKHGVMDAKSADLPRGVLVGTVELFDCIQDDDGWFMWHLRKPERLPKPLKPVHRANPVWFHPFGESDGLEDAVTEAVVQPPKRKRQRSQTTEQRPANPLRTAWPWEK